jgi:hypothetical protein
MERELLAIEVDVEQSYSKIIFFSKPIRKRYNESRNWKMGGLPNNKSKWKRQWWKKKLKIGIGSLNDTKGTINDHKWPSPLNLGQKPRKGPYKVV